MVIIRGHHLAIRVLSYLVMATANWIGELKNVFPTVILTRIVILKIDAQMKNVFHKILLVKRKGNVLKGLLVKIAFVNQLGQHVIDT